MNNTDPAMSLINGGVGNVQGQELPAMSLINGGIGNVQGQQLPPEAIKSAQKTLTKYYDAHAEQLVNQPGGAEILASLIKNAGGLKDNPEIKPAKGMFQSASVTPEGDIQRGGIFGGFTGPTTDMLLKQLTSLSDINKNNRQGIGFNTEESLRKMFQLQGKVDEVLPGYKVDQTAEGNIIIRKGDSDNSEMMLGMKEDQFKTRILQKMGDDLDPSKNVRNPYGVAQLGLSRAERIEGLVSQYKDLNLDRRETEELAIGLNSMLQGSNQSARNQVMSLVPSSARGTVSKLTEWLVNEPQGLNQQKFVQRMLDDVRREKQVFQGQVMKFARSKVAKYKSLIEKYPEETSDILRSFNVDPEAYAKWKDSGFKDQPPIEVSKSDNNVTSSGWDASKEARYQELLKKRGK